MSCFALRVLFLCLPHIPKVFCCQSLKEAHKGSESEDAFWIVIQGESEESPVYKTNLLLMNVTERNEAVSCLKNEN